MIVAATVLYLICGSALTSGSLYGVETFAGEEWWAQGIFLKFYSPSGKNYFIHQESGEISLESLDSMQESAKDMTSPSPYITFVSSNLKVYDIYFEQQDLQYIPHIVEKPVNYQDKFMFVRHSLQSFVGPNKLTYTLHTKQSNISNIEIKSAKPERTIDDLQIKTLGPYSKWVHTYTFSENGQTATDLTLSPIETSPERSISLAEKEASSLKDVYALRASFNTPSGKRYLVTNELNMARDQSEVDDQSYVSFIEPNGKEYDIRFRKDGSEYVAIVVARDSLDEDNYSYSNKRQTVQLLSFVGPDKKTYRIDRTTENGEEVPVLGLDSSKSSDFRVTFVVKKNVLFKSLAHFIFSNDGKDLNDRVDEYDPTVLANQPPLSIDEVEVNGEIARSSFLTFYAPSGRIYYLSPNDTKATFVVAKGIHKNSESPYMSFPVEDGRTCNVYYASSGETDMKFISPADGTNPSTRYSLFSFVTPDKKFHKILSHVENDVKIPYIDMTAQPKDPFDENQEDALQITIVSAGREYNYMFTWNGDKLVEVSSRPLKRVSSNVLKSLIG